MGREEFKDERVRAVFHGDAVLWGPPRKPVTLEGGSLKSAWL